ncbi:carboxymethylenebutenolidase [Lentzea sp. NBRC 105346]|uniref:dienelactone hydrolase family protein n=1 Tax=Lentzea sp. NBRC 105346 TaxID=3032205 RepID=UPI0024A24D2F|nr:dienelactone hydrolase family protein [Lentzea sp. NBRC 105346]GLZ33178.1 carboxymethylenebutenolidase [Lentzea sp. NBRC 105346]
MSTRIPLPVWQPPAGTGPGIVLIQEIFGLDDYLRSVAADLAALGYVVGVPELFHRFSPGWCSGHDQAGVQASMEVAGKLDFEQAVADVIEAVGRLGTERTGLLGFCLGGSLAFAAAAQSSPDTVVSFYGSAVPGSVGLLSQITCPIQFHFGGQDPYITRDQVQIVEDAVAEHDNAEIHVQEDAGHAFHNHVAPMFHQPAAAARAWDLTTAFLARTLPVG